MNTASKNWLPGVIGAVIGLGTVALFATGVVAPGSGVWSQRLLDDASLGRAVGEFIGLGFSLGLLAFGLRRIAAHASEDRRFESREPSVARDAAEPGVVIAIPRIADATASEVDDARLPAFAPVTSLTEAQVERQRAERKRQQHRVALKGA